MAVTATKLASEMILVMDNGVGASGQQLSKNRIYKNIKTDTTDDAIHAVAQTVIGLQSKTNLGIQRRDTVELISA